MPNYLRMMLRHPDADPYPCDEVMLRQAIALRAANQHEQADEWIEHVERRERRRRWAA